MFSPESIQPALPFGIIDGFLSEPPFPVIDGVSPPYDSYLFLRAYVVSVARRT